MLIASIALCLITTLVRHTPRSLLEPETLERLGKLERKVKKQWKIFGEEYFWKERDGRESVKEWILGEYF